MGLNAVQQRDKDIASSTVNALCTYSVLYGRDKNRMGPA